MHIHTYIYYVYDSEMFTRTSKNSGDGRTTTRPVPYKPKFDTAGVVFCGQSHVGMCFLHCCKLDTSEV